MDKGTLTSLKNTKTSSLDYYFTPQQISSAMCGAILYNYNKVLGTNINAYDCFCGCPKPRNLIRQNGLQNFLINFWSDLWIYLTTFFQYFNYQIYKIYLLKIQVTKDC
jgi:hypothetical protein